MGINWVFLQLKLHIRHLIFCVNFILFFVIHTNFSFPMQVYCTATRSNDWKKIYEFKPEDKPDFLGINRVICKLTEFFASQVTYSKIDTHCEYCSFVIHINFLFPVQVCVAAQPNVLQVVLASFRAAVATTLFQVAPVDRAPALTRAGRYPAPHLTTAQQLRTGEPARPRKIPYS